MPANISGTGFGEVSILNMESRRTLSSPREGVSRPGRSYSLKSDEKPLFAHARDYVLLAAVKEQADEYCPRRRSLKMPRTPEPPT
jgi:hypothetical protein